MNYEYLLMDVTDTIDRPYIRFKNVIWCDVDCKEDFKKLQNELYRALCRKENPFDEDNLRSHLKAVFPGVDITAANIMQIGGMSNKNFKVVFNGKGYDVLLKRVEAQMYEGWEAVREQVMALEARLNNLGVDLKPCHNDALYENFIKAEDRTIYLIDWENSGMNDPMADIGALFIEADFSEENQDYFLNKYFDGEIPEKTREKILCYQILWDYLWAQWTVIKEKKGDDFGTYGPDRFNRAISNLQLLHKNYTSQK